MYNDDTIEIAVECFDKDLQTDFRRRSSLIMSSGISVYLNDLSQPLCCDICGTRSRSRHDSSVFNSFTLHDVRLLNSVRNRSRLPADMRLQLRSEIIRTCQRIIHFHHQHHDGVPVNIRNHRIYLCS